MQPHEPSCLCEDAAQGDALQIPSRAMPRLRAGLNFFPPHNNNNNNNNFQKAKALGRP